MRIRTSLPLVAIALFVTVPALAAPSYTTNFNSGGQINTPTPQDRTVSGALAPSNGTGTFTGHAYAGPGQVNTSTRTDCIWANGFSGSFGSWTTANATTDDLIITGPSGSVHGTIHLRVSAAFDAGGGYPDNGAANNGLFWFHAGTPQKSAFGQVNWYKTTMGGSGWLSAVNTHSFDLDIPLEADYPVNTPITFHISTEMDAGDYGNAAWNPGWAQVDGGTGGGVSLRTGAPVMDLPAGYTLNSAAWLIRNNVLAVDDGPRPAALRLQLASANPVVGDARLRLSLPRAGRVRVVIHDAMGRVVRSLADDWCEAGVHDLHWDGRDDTGGAARAGLYFARVSALGETVSQRVVRVR